MMIGEKIANCESYFSFFMSRIIFESRSDLLARGRMDMFVACARAGGSTLRTESARTRICLRSRISREELTGRLSLALSLSKQIRHSAVLIEYSEANRCGAFSGTSLLLLIEI